MNAKELIHGMAMAAKPMIVTPHLSPKALMVEIQSKMDYARTRGIPSDITQLTPLNAAILLACSPSFRDFVGIRVYDQFDNATTALRNKLVELHREQNSPSRLKTALIVLNQVGTGQYRL